MLFYKGVCVCPCVCAGICASSQLHQARPIAVLDGPMAAYCADAQQYEKSFYVSSLILINTTCGQHHQNRLLYSSRGKFL